MNIGGTTNKSGSPALSSGLSGKGRAFSTDSESRLDGEQLQRFGLQDGQECALDGDELFFLELVQHAADGFTCGAGHAGDLFLRERHGEARFRVAGLDALLA